MNTFPELRQRGTLARAALTLLTALAPACGHDSHATDVGPADAAIDAADPPHDADDASTTVDTSASDDASTMDDTVIAAGDPLPAFDSDTEAHIRTVAGAGRARGNRADVMAKIGDSISESRAYLYPCGSGTHMLGSHGDVADTITYFTATMVDMDFNSFERPSLTATSGWTAADAIQGGDGSPLAMELDAIHPLWGVVMYGTNDLERTPDLATYVSNMNQLLDIMEQRGTVPILSTIPPRNDGEPFGSRVPVFNDAIRTLAHNRHVPLMDYWVLLNALPDHGLGDDGVHPTVYAPGGDSDGCNFTDDALRYGYNVRNLLAVQALGRMRSY